MGFTSWANSKIKKLNWVDIVFIEFSCIAFGILLVALIPKLIEVNIWLIFIIFIILGLKPGYRAFSS